MYPWGSSARSWKSHKVGELAQLTRRRRDDKHCCICINSYERLCLDWLILLHLIDKSIPDHTFPPPVRWNFPGYDLWQQTQSCQSLHACVNRLINTDICAMFVFVLSGSLTACVSISWLRYISLTQGNRLHPQLISSSFTTFTQGDLACNIIYNWMTCLLFMRLPGCINTARVVTHCVAGVLH